MVEQQLVDYIKKARQAGQQDSQTKALLVKNGWTEEEINEAILAANQQRPQAQQPQHQVSGQPEVRVQQKPEPRPEPQYQPQQPRYETQPAAAEGFGSARPAPAGMPERRGAAGIILKLLIILILLTVIGAGGYFAITQQSQIKSFFNQFFSYSVEIVQPVKTTLDNTQKTQTPAPAELATKNIVSVLEEYDSSKIIFSAFNESGSVAAYCASKKTDGKFSCFSN